MKTLRDLVLEAEDAAVIEAIARLCEQEENEWLARAIAQVPAELRRLTADRAGADYELHIEHTVPLDPGEEPAWDIWCSKENDSERYGLDLSRWEEWLAVRVPQSLLDAMPGAAIVAHCVWEMTFYGFTQDRIAETRTELERRVREVDEGKAELIPWEEAKERLRGELGLQKEDSRPAE